MSGDSNKQNYLEQDLVIDEEPEIEMAQLAEDAEDYILANELEKWQDSLDILDHVRNAKWAKKLTITKL